MTTWILLRGLGRERAHWGDFPQQLRERLPRGARVLALDLPGNGSRWRERSPATIHGLLEATRSELQALRPEPPYALVALSLGAMVALQWAAARPHELQACVLVNTSLGALSPFWQRLHPRAYPTLLRALTTESLADRERAVWRLSSTWPLDAKVLDAWTAIAARHPVSRLNVARQLLAAARFRAPARVDVPMLLVASGRDRLVSPRCSEAIARAWGLPLEQHPWAGHDLALDDPAWLADRIARWSLQPMTRPSEVSIDCVTKPALRRWPW